TRTGRRDRLEPQMLQRLCRADIKGVGQHEAPPLMHLAECGPFVTGCQRHRFLPIAPLAANIAGWWSRPNLAQKCSLFAEYQFVVLREIEVGDAFRVIA